MYTWLVTRRTDQIRPDVDTLQAARDTGKLASNDDDNVGSAFALNTTARRGRAGRARSHACGLMFWLTLNRLFGSYFALI